MPIDKGVGSLYSLEELYDLGRGVAPRKECQQHRGVVLLLAHLGQNNPSESEIAALRCTFAAPGLGDARCYLDAAKHFAIPQEHVVGVVLKRLRNELPATQCQHCKPRVRESWATSKRGGNGPEPMKVSEKSFA